MNQFSKVGQNSGDSADFVQFQYLYNKRKLKIALENNFISREQSVSINKILAEECKKGEQSDFEEIFNSDSSLSFVKLRPVLNKEMFKYNQIIIKLAQQFAKNLIIQQLKLQKKNKQEIQKAIASVQKKFSVILKKLTSEYLDGEQEVNIDNLLLEFEVIKVSHLEFLHDTALQLEIKVQDRKFGEIAVKNQFTTQESVINALNEQTAIYQKTKKNHIIGDILVEKKQISSEVRDEILIIQNRVLEEDWEQILKTTGQQSIEEKEKNALFGALIIRNKLLDQEKVVKALKIQAMETAEFLKKED